MAHINVMWFEFGGLGYQNPERGSFVGSSLATKFEFEPHTSDIPVIQFDQPKSWAHAIPYTLRVFPTMSPV